ncbi:unnamed protein product [Trichobilharzia regenti]|nr:unnamed protein product [Trichobilharzia regenti]
MSKFAGILLPTSRIEKSESKTQSFTTKGSQISGYRKNSVVSSNPYKLNECNRFRGTSPTDRLQVARQTRLCFTRFQEVHTKANCESVTKFSDKLNVMSASSSSDFTNFQGNTSQKKVDHTNGGTVDTCDNGHDRAHLSLTDHDEMSEMTSTTTTELNKSSVQLEHEVELKADAVVSSVDTHETVSVNDQSVAHLSSDDSAKPELITKDIAQFNEDKPTVDERVIVELTCTNKGLSSFKLLFECYYLFLRLVDRIRGISCVISSSLVTCWRKNNGFSSRQSVLWFSRWLMQSVSESLRGTP